MALSAKAAHAKDAGKVADLQHRHFATIATFIAQMDHGPSTFGQWSRDDIAAHFADKLAATNPKFDRARFLAACRA